MLLHTNHTAYAKSFATGTFHSDFHCCNETIAADQTWNAFKTHFATAYHHHKQMQGEKAAASGYVIVYLAQPADDNLAGESIDVFANLATATSGNHTSQTLKESRYHLQKERNERGSCKPFAPSNDNYCWNHGYKIARNNTHENCLYPKTGHTHDATKYNNMGVSQANKD
jgi:hypothetical protein